MNLKIKEANKLYRNIGTLTRLFIKLSLTVYLFLIIFSVFANFSPIVQENYNLIFLPEQSLETAKSVLGIGSIGSFLLIATDNTQRTTDNG